MTEPAARSLEVVQIAVGDLEANPWNPNSMDDRTRVKLAAYLRQEGLVQPLVVRRLPGRKVRYQILGGQHRWEVCRDDLAYETVPCVVVDVDDRRARVLTVNLNELSGEPVPHRMAELVHELSRDTTLDDLASLMPYTERELADLQELLKVPAGLELELEEQARAHRDGSPTMITFVVDEAEPVEAAIAGVAETLEGKNRRGRALVAICQAHLDRQPPQEPEDSAAAQAS